MAPLLASIDTLGNIVMNSVSLLTLLSFNYYRIELQNNIKLLFKKNLNPKNQIIIISLLLIYGYKSTIYFFLMSNFYLETLDMKQFPVCTKLMCYFGLQLTQWIILLPKVLFILISLIYKRDLDLQIKSMILISQESQSSQIVQKFRKISRNLIKWQTNYKKFQKMIEIPFVCFDFTIFTIMISCFAYAFTDQDLTWDYYLNQVSYALAIYYAGYLTDSISSKVSLK